jgi:hypothetical protein
MKLKKIYQDKLENLEYPLMKENMLKSLQNNKIYLSFTIHEGIDFCNFLANQEFTFNNFYNLFDHEKI